MSHVVAQVSCLGIPVTKLDETRMTTKAEWRCRPQEISKMAEAYMYGEKPLPPSSVTGCSHITSGKRAAIRAPRWF